MRASALRLCAPASAGGPDVLRAGACVCHVFIPSGRAACGAGVRGAVRPALHRSGLRPPDGHAAAADAEANKPADDVNEPAPDEENNKPAASNSESGSNTGLIVGIIVAVVAVAIIAVVVVLGKKKKA